ncbi:hypothetical protein V8G54_001827 [Vigna mungo]|uniref:Transposase-associated domain-containing protein n=1 Tax=Vigna mungo TaxID=3915 RepID=A0AAQ3SBA6_VIGMU
MDQSWIHQLRISEEFERGISEFKLYVKERTKPVNGAYFCPCVSYLNQAYEDLDNIRDHLFIYGIMRSYTVWTWHGEVLLYKPTNLRGLDYVEEWKSDHLDEMVRDVGAENFGRAHLYDSLNNNSKQELYPRCINFTRLSAILKLFCLKARNGWTDKSFMELLELLKEMLPENIMLPIRNYDAKKILCLMGLEYKRYMHVPMIVYCIKISMLQ